LAPTILEIAGQKKPEWMQGESLAPWLNSETKPQGKGLAFTQYLEKNSVFKPLHHGTLGVIDDQYEYVFYLDTGKGELRPLSESHVWNVDRSAEEPARAKALHDALHARFPAMVPADEPAQDSRHSRYPRSRCSRGDRGQALAKPSPEPPLHADRTAAR
jgi:arylsulfatase A-like enzyme